MGTRASSTVCRTTRPSSVKAGGDPPLPATGTRRGRYVLLGRLGEGGMGVVFAAYDPRLCREVALKLLRWSEEHREEATSRLLAEAHAMARLSHPNVVPVFDVDRDAEGVLLAMERVHGESLDAWLQTPRAPQAVLRAFVHAGRGLAAAHRANLVHRDFKPSNVLVGDDGRVRVTDFGLARPVAGEGTDSSEHGLESSVEDPRGPGGPGLTEAGVVMGTEPYMAPEQHRGRPVGAAADQYAFCVSLWKALVGRRPFRGDGAALLHAKEQGPPPWPRSVRIPRRTARAIRRGLAVDPADRWPALEPLLRELDRAAGGGRSRRVAASLGVVALVGSGAGAWAVEGGEQPCMQGAARFSEAWNPEAREAVRARFAASDRPFATTSWERVEAGLDGYMAAWIEGYRDACEDTHLRRGQPPEILDRRMACLSRRRAGVRTTVEVLREADDALILRAVDVVGALPPAQGCADPQVIASGLPSPDDSSLAAEVARLREEVDSVAALRRAGRYDLARVRAQALLESAAAVEHPPLMAEVQLTRGRLFAELDDQAAAASALAEATRTATAVGHVEVAAWAASSLAFVVGQRLKQPGAGEAWGRIGLALARRYQPGGRSEAYAEQTLGALYADWARYDRAERHTLAALELRAALDGRDSVETAPMLNNLGHMRITQGRYEEGLQYLERALQVREAELGPHHPYVGITLMNLTAVLLRLERWAEAEAVARRTVENMKRNYGAVHVKVATAIANHGATLQGLGRPDEAADRYQHAIEIYERDAGDHRRDLTIALSNLAMLREQAGDLDEAEALLRRVLSVREQMPEHASLVHTLQLLAGVRLARGDRSDAQRFLARARGMATRVLPDDHPDWAELDALQRRL